MLEKEVAELNIFNSIFESIKYKGFSALQYPINLNIVSNQLIGKFTSTDSFNNYLFFNRFKSTPLEYTLQIAGVGTEFNVQEQEKWFRKYLDKPNKVIREILGKYLNELSKNSRLKNSIESDFLECILNAMREDAVNFNDSIEENLTCEQFQDLVFIVSAETIYNPEIEDKISLNFSESNGLFWNRFNELYATVFYKLFCNEKIITDSFFLSKKIEEDRKILGFELLEDALNSSKYPKYPSHLMPYLNISYKQNRDECDDEYLDYRKREFSLYCELCDLYGIVGIREEMI